MKLRLGELRRRLREELELVEKAKRQTCIAPECGQPAWANTLEGPRCYAHAREMNESNRPGDVCTCGKPDCGPCNAPCPECGATNPSHGKMDCSTCWRRRQGRLREVVKKCGEKWYLYTKGKKAGKRKRLGSHPSKAAAERQEKAIHAHGG